MKLHRPSFIALTLLAAAVHSVSSQQSTQTPTFRTRVDAVTVDVTATDAKGRPVTDLTAEDFAITENGKLQSINSFRRFAIPEIPPDTTPAPITSLDTQEREAARDDVRLIAIFLDEYHTRLVNAMAVREMLARFIAGLDPRDMVAVMYPLTPSSLLTFSRDHEGTARAVRKFEGRKYDYLPRYPQEDIYVKLSPLQIENLRNWVVVDAMTGLNTVLGSFHDRRKTILMVSEGLVSFLPPRRRPSRDAPPGIRGPASTGSIATLGEMDKLVDLQNRMREIFTAAARGNTSVYTLDPRGLPVTEFDLTEVDSFVDSRFLRESTDSLRLIAEETGGRAIVGTNDPQPLLRQMLVDSSAYYLLGYTSTEAPHDGKFHEIAVRVKRKGIDVRARKGYWALSPDDVARANKPDVPTLPVDISDALAASATPATGRLVRTWVGFDRGERGQTAVTIVWEAAADRSAGEPVDHAVVIVSSSNGEPVFRGKSTRDPLATSSAGRVMFNARPGAIRVRVSAEGASGQSLDAEERELMVPDFTAVGPIVTPPEVYRGNTARELTQLRESNTMLPTVSHQFTRSDHLLLRFRAYAPGGSMPNIAVRLRNSQGETLSTLPPPRQRRADQFEITFLPASLAPGTYLIEIEASSATARDRTLWGFTIRER